MEIRRVKRLPDRNVYYIDVGNMNKKETEAIIEKMKGMLCREKNSKNEKRRNEKK
jgi:hypothetical protein